ncbi:unnamed protein product [Echinostoma caproni]|uniref:BPTI/Kunitz inhibitor domain-containing protein n=1 Tax=Echinostoma caproni TaxID=27848 RepID=A0A183A032_9TREM|nr:unnamed protein product [Echinostoma caproni]
MHGSPELLTSVSLLIDIIVDSVNIPEQCKLPLLHGICRVIHRVWGYSTQLERCIPFTYTGCAGNRNRFDSEWACSSGYGNDQSFSVSLFEGYVKLQPVGECCSSRRDYVDTCNYLYLY